MEKGQGMRLAGASALTGHKKTWPLRGTLWRAGVFLLISAAVAMFRPVRRGWLVVAPPVSCCKGEMYADAPLQHPPGVAPLPFAATNSPKHEDNH
ncbi:hypothetical protein CQW29_27190 [Pantoea coffeiphila]|uniref:Uncharacterized protein n=1 Tax=Pantoea coffeiphila TaxID=1465635 RepID=A0A2S9I3D8_9GAMM|nr:hypothetical protein CQW29_27190 [Pantoea coffeiphila]